MRIKLIDCRDLGKAQQEEVLSQQIRPLYEGSFPKEERRAWADLLSLLDKEQAFSLRIIVLQEGEESEFLGFISLWNLSEEWLFVEHFALVPEQRSSRRFTQLRLSFWNAKLPAPNLLSDDWTSTLVKASLFYLQLTNSLRIIRMKGEAYPTLCRYTS